MAGTTAKAVYQQERALLNAADREHGGDTAVTPTGSKRQRGENNQP